MTHNCIKCGAPLIVGENITQERIDLFHYICRSCEQKYYQEYYQKHREQYRKYNQDHREHQRNRVREYKHRMGIQHPMNRNRDCSVFLGVYVAERVLSHVFKHVEKMPYGNPGYDFICGGGYKIDVKSSCRRTRKNRVDNWGFCIRKNQIADYFLCLAFDNRDDLTPKHIWLIPGDVINDHVSVSISETMLTKWDEYKLDINKVITCCNTMKAST